MFASKYEHGLLTYIDNAYGHVVHEVPMTQCAHCGLPFPLPRPYADKSPEAVESRKNRGFCVNCSGHVCGPSCSECVHWKKMLAIAEGRESATAVQNKATTLPPSKLWLPPLYER